MNSDSEERQVADKISEDPSWLTDARIREIKHGDDATYREVQALAGEVRERRRAMKRDSQATSTQS
jgi:alkylated DNA nucleotide flippase Atl1